MVTLAEATLRDADILAEIEKLIFQYDVISLRQMRYLIMSKAAIVMKAFLSDGTIVGYMVLLRRSNSKVLRLYSLAVRQNYRSAGVGRLLLKCAEGVCGNTGCDRLQLEVQMQNKQALLFYLSAGYTLYGRRSGYYTDGSTALLLRRQVIFLG